MVLPDFDALVNAAPNAVAGSINNKLTVLLTIDSAKMITKLNIMLEGSAVVGNRILSLYLYTYYIYIKINSIVVEQS